MARPTALRGTKPAAKGQKGAKGQKKRSASAAFPEEANRDEFFEASDSDAPSEGEEEAQAETAAEKRLRIAREYLHQMKTVDEQEGGDSEEDEAAQHDSLGALLRQNALEAAGYMQRKIAERISIPDLRTTSGAEASTSGRFLKTSLPVTAVCLTSDEGTAYSVSKDGSICAHDIQTGKRSKFDWQHITKGAQANSTTADWVKRKAQSVGKNALLAIAISHDDKYLAVGGGDKKIHVWDARSRQYLRSLHGSNGHKDIVTGLAFREGTHQLFSCGADRQVKIWSLADMSYVDTLFGHQSEVLAVDVLRQERAVSSGHDHTCRVWKIPDESQLIFRSHGMAIDCCKYITGTEWVTGASDGTLALWSQTKKRPTSILRKAHGFPRPGLVSQQTSTVAGSAAPAVATADASRSTDAENGGAAANGTSEEEEAWPVGPGSVGGDAASWIGAVGVCRGTDLVASGAGDGLIRLWRVADGKVGKVLQELGALPARGFVNSVQIAKSGKFLVAGMGQEPRLGRWARDGSAKNGLLIHQLVFAPE